MKPLKKSTKSTTSVALGNFDGLHIAHMSLIRKTKEFKAFVPCVWTFSEHTSSVLENGPNVPYITSNDEKIEILRQENIDCLIFQDFNLIRRLLAEEFIDKILIDYLNAQVVVCGFDFKFGYMGLGDADFLKEKLARKNIETVVIPPIICDGEVVSSSLVRMLIENGDMPRAHKFLGRPFSVKLSAVGLPALCDYVFPAGKVIPASGVYDCTCEIGGEAYKTVANVTKHKQDHSNTAVITVETIDETIDIDFDDNLHERGGIKLNFHEKIK